MTTDELNLAVHLALLWNPPQAASFTTANQAHGWSLRVLAGKRAEPVPEVVTKRVELAATQIAAADYLPGCSPDDKWPQTVASDQNTLIAHPLSPGDDETSKSPICLPTADMVDQAIDRCWPHQDWTGRKPTLALWRWLPDALRLEQNSAKTDEHHSGVPVAHPAYPDSVWAVGALRAAAVTAGQNPAILFVSLASVQEYIAEARRTQDLWMGSYLYAYLMWHAMRPLVEKLGPWSILTPNLRGLPFLDLWLATQGVTPPVGCKPDAARFSQLLQVANLPNVFTALVPAAEAADYAKLAVAGMAEARNRIAHAVKHRLSQVIEAETWESLWDKQIASFAVCDAFWAAVPWRTPDQDRKMLRTLLDNGFEQATEAWQAWVKASGGVDSVHTGAGFPLVNQAAAMLHAMRKNLRNFGPAPEADPGPLCTLCATRSAIRLTSGSLSEHRRAWERLGQTTRSTGVKLQGRIRKGELLCAVCLMKRLALDSYFDDESERPKDDRSVRAVRAAAKFGVASQADGSEINLAMNRHLFASTATVATMPFRLMLAQQLATAAKSLDHDAPQDRATDDPHLRQNAAMRVLEAVANWVDQLNKAVGKEARVPATVPKHAKMPELATARYKIIEQIDQLDGSWFYPSDYDIDSIQRELDLERIDRSAVEAARRALADVLAPHGPLRFWIDLQNRTEPDENKKVRYRPPARYYAVINVDGDHVGEWVNGKNNSTFKRLLSQAVPNMPEQQGNLQRPPGPLSQAALSTAGSNFAFHVAPSIVARHDGSLIFAGGDDTLALASREKALSLAQQLELAFRQRYTDRGELLMGPNATLSTAIVIAHVSEPLTEVVRAAHDALKNVAKASYGRNAFAIHLRKRSGPAVTAGITWHVAVDTRAAGTREIDCAAALDIVRKAFAGPLSRGLLGDLRRDGRALGGSGGPTLDPQDHELIRGELRRLAKRHLPEGSDTTLDAFSDLYDAVRTRLRAKDKTTREYEYYTNEQADATRPTAWEVVFGLARVAEFLAREDEE